MTAREQAHEIRNLVDALWDADLLLDSNLVTHPSDTGGRVTWVSTPARAQPPWQVPHDSIETYKKWLETRSFSVVLFDGALLQLTFDFEGPDLSAHRLAYVPCPLDIDPETLRLLSLLDVFEAYGPIAVEGIRLRGAVRFDYDPSRARENHSAAHMTMLTSSCRVPAAGPLSLGHFVRFIFRSFYPELWAVHDFIRNWSSPMAARTLLVDDEILVHMNWRDGIAAA